SRFESANRSSSVTLKIPCCAPGRPKWSPSTEMSYATLMLIDPSARARRRPERSRASLLRPPYLVITASQRGPQPQPVKLLPADAVAAHGRTPVHLCYP